MLKPPSPTKLSTRNCPSSTCPTRPNGSARESTACTIPGIRAPSRRVEASSGPADPLPEARAGPRNPPPPAPPAPPAGGKPPRGARPVINPKAEPQLGPEAPHQKDRPARPRHHAAGGVVPGVADLGRIVGVAGGAHEADAERRADDDAVAQRCRPVEVRGHGTIARRHGGWRRRGCGEAAGVARSAAAPIYTERGAARPS